MIVVHCMPSNLIEQLVKLKNSFVKNIHNKCRENSQFASMLLSLDYILTKFQMSRATMFQPAPLSHC